MVELRFSIHFEKFEDSETIHVLKKGLNIIYGESGVGKSHFLESILKSKKSDDHNFFIKIESELLDSYLISQNPDNQIICRTVGSELAFNGECIQKTPLELETIVNQGLKTLPATISSTMNPGFLSGGEKEFLNIVTATQLKREMLLIDDGLSFLSQKNKRKILVLLKKWVEDNHGIVVWITSDYEDLQHVVDRKWILDLTSFYPYLDKKHKVHEPLVNPSGNLDLSVKNLSFNYENGREIFTDFSLNVKNARCLALLGDNGSGKTTFAGLCFGDLSPVKGSLALEVMGNDKIKVGYLDQFPENLILLDTPSQFLKKIINLSLFDLEFEPLFKERLLRFGINWEAIKDIVGIKLPWILLRTSLTVMLSHCKFDILILDEPSFGLGWNQRVILRSFLKEIMMNKHFIIVSHDKIFSQSICDKIIDFDTLKVSG
jgi:energy-coupling factor transporter ATP-binding protein EcfA2